MAQLQIEEIRAIDTFIVIVLLKAYKLSTQETGTQSGLFKSAPPMLSPIQFLFNF